MNGHAHFSASIQELSHMLLWIRNHLIEAGMQLKDVRKFELASEEAIVNIIHHAYLEKEGRIELFYKLSAGQLEIAIVDYGPPFNPLKQEAPDVSSSLDQRREGGLGIFLMNHCVDDLRYQRDGQANVLTLIKRFSQKK